MNLLLYFSESVDPFLIGQEIINLKNEDNINLSENSSEIDKEEMNYIQY